jgi:dTDP-4-amino-4,6-dideoxygalactose transaminase
LAAALATSHGVEHVLLCASGTAAVELALRGGRVGPGDEVILAAYEFKANFQNVLALGAVPVLVDVRPDDWQLDAGRVADAVTGRTRAVIVSHLHGGVVDMPRVVETARQHGLSVIEDACQCPGALIHGRTAGTWGDAGVLSFGGSKLLSAGRGGAVLTADAALAQRIRLHTQRGNEAYPLSELQAAVLLPQWDRLAERNARRGESVAVLRELLADSTGLTPLPHGEHSRPGYYKLGLRYDAEAFAGLPRDRFAAAMRAEGIALDPGFRSLHLTHSRRRFRASGPLTEADQADDRVLVLHHPVLLEDKPALRQIFTALEKIREFAVRNDEFRMTNSE